MEVRIPPCTSTRQVGKAVKGIAVGDRVGVVLGTGMDSEDVENGSDRNRLDFATTGAAAHRIRVSARWAVPLPLGAPAGWKWRLPALPSVPAAPRGPAASSCLEAWGAPANPYAPSAAQSPRRRSVNRHLLKRSPAQPSLPSLSTTRHPAPTLLTPCPHPVHTRSGSLPFNHRRADAARRRRPRGGRNDLGRAQEGAAAQGRQGIVV